MPVESDALFLRFPTDGGIYRIHWAGNLLPPKVGTSTKRVGVWLKKVDVNENGEHTIDNGQLGKDLPVFTYLDESVGSIPELAIGTYWQDGKRINAPKGLEDAIVSFEIPPEQQWEIVFANQTINLNPYRKRISSDEYATYGLNSAQQKQVLYSAPLLKVCSTDGKELLIPAYEIFRAYFAGCSQLSLALLSDSYKKAIDSLVVPNSTGFDSDGVFQIELAKDLRTIALRYLALILGTTYGADAAAQIHVRILNQAKDHPKWNPWIEATPPFPSLQSIKLNVAGKWIQEENCFLAYRITHTPFPSLPFTINRIIETQYIPIDEAVSTEHTGLGDAQEPKTRTHVEGVKVGKAGDAKLTQKTVHIDALGVTWEADSLPKWKNISRTKRYFPRKISEDDQVLSVIKEVSVGAKSTNGSLPRGAMSTEAIEEIVSRFDALNQCLNRLLCDEKIDSWDDCALVRPFNVLERNFCALVEIKDKNINPWAIISQPTRRSRLVWLVRLQRNGRTVYWLDIEARSKSDLYCALVFTTLHNEPLTNHLLKRLLVICTNIVGRWPSQAGFGLQDALIWTKADHKLEGTSLKPSAVLGAIDRVIRLSRKNS